MPDLFVTLTPLLLLGVIFLLGFVGCDIILGLNQLEPRKDVSNIGQTMIVQGSNGPGGATAQATVSFSDKPKLIVATVVWPTGGGTLSSLMVTGGTFQPPVKTDQWSGYSVHTALAPNVPTGSSITVTATLSSPSTPSPWFMCVTVYDNADPTNPAFSPTSLSSTTTAVITPISFSVPDANDLIYAVAIAQPMSSSFANFTGQLAPASGFTAEQNLGYVLIEDQPQSAVGTVSVGADTTGTNAAKWYLIAVGIKHA